MSPTLPVLTVAALIAGVMNAMAGGGTFITFPALTGIAGLTEKVANITSTVGLWPGSAASVVAARKPIQALGRSVGLLYVTVGALGGAIGAVLLLTTTTSAFAKAVPWLLAFATTLFAAGPVIHTWGKRENRGKIRARPSTPAVLAVVLLIAVYNGYFGAGGSVLLLGGLAMLMPGDVRQLNVLKVLVQSSANASAVVVFLSAGVDWRIAATMAVGSAAGGFLGMRLATRMPARMLYWVILVVATALTVAYFGKSCGGGP